MSASLNYASTPLSAMASLTTGDTSRTAPTTVSALLSPSGATGGALNVASGAQIERITLLPLATCTATTVRLFWYDGTNYHLKFEMQLGAVTLSSSVATAGQTFEAVDNPNLFPMLLPAGWSARATINDTQAGGVNIILEGGGF